MNKELIRAAGGIVHSDGNIFFTNQAQLDAYARAAIQQAAGAVPKGWKLVPNTPTPAMIAAATVAVLPDASPADFELAREAARIVLAHPNAPEGVSLEAIAAAMATIIPAHKAMLAAAPAPPKQQPVHLVGGEGGGVPLSDEQRRDLLVGRAVQRAARDLPVGWELTVNLERGAGWVEWTNDQGNTMSVDGCGEPFHEQINAAIESAIKEASNGND